MTEEESSDSHATGDGASATTDQKALDNQHSLWVRWTDVDSTALTTEFDGVPIGDIHLHRYCDIIPTKQSRESEHNAKGKSEDYQESQNEPEFKFVDGIVRTGLRFTPTIILFATLGLVVYGELSPAVEGVLSLVPAFPPYVFSYAVGAILIWLFILTLANRINLVHTWDLTKAVIVFGLIGVLLAGAVYSTYLVTTVSEPYSIPPNVIFVSGYLLLILLGGLLIYDGMLKTEFMIDNFGEWKHSIVSEKKVYNLWKEDLYNDLHDSFFGVPTTHILALLFVSQFGVIWWVQHGPQGPQELNSNVTLLLNLLIDFFIVVIAFHFLILVKYMHELLSDSYTPKDATENVGAQKILQYEPFHIDRHGGFKDLGRFATRVNVLLVIAGIYTVFRLYVQGVRALPVGGITGFQSEFGLLLWVGSYILPIVAYGIAAVAWLYYSFWAMHRKMILEKQTLFMNTQGTRSEGEVMPAVGDPVEDFQEGPDWYYLNTAPEWPINSRWLVSLASANVAPLLLPILNLLSLS